MSKIGEVVFEGYSSGDGECFVWHDVKVIEAQVKDKQEIENNGFLYPGGALALAGMPDPYGGSEKRYRFRIVIEEV